MLKVGHVVVLLLRNVEGWSCSSFAVKKLKVGHVVVLLLRNVEGWSCSSFVVQYFWRKLLLRNVEVM